MNIVIVHLNSTAHSVRTLYFDIVCGRVSHESFRLVLSGNVLDILDDRGGFPTSLPPRVKFNVLDILDVRGGFSTSLPPRVNI